MIFRHSKQQSLKDCHLNPLSLTNEQTVCVIVVIYCATNRLLGSQTIRAVLIRNGSASFNRCRKLSAIPCEGVRASVVIAERIADTVIGNGLSVVLRQLVEPLGVAVGIGVSRKQFIDAFFIHLDRKQISIGIVSIFVTNVTLHNLDELTLCIIGVIDGQIATSVDDRDIAQLVIRIGVRIQNGAVRFHGIARDQRGRAVARKFID